ncbi:MAG: type II secretion system protein [Acidobacteriota bacterium]
MTLIEILMAIFVIVILVGALVPVAKFTVKRHNELELRRSLRMMRRAIDEYKKFCDAGAIPKEGVDSECYPPDLETLVDGVEKTGSLGQEIRFLRRIPLDPMTKTYEWGLRSYQDDPDSTNWGRQNVYDVYTTHEGKALDGTYYKDW